MTPGEKRELVTELSTVLATVIDRKLVPIVKRLDDLEGANQQHDRGIRDARVEVTRSKNDIEASTNDAMLAAVRHCDGTMQAMTVELQAVKEAQQRIEQNSTRSLVKVTDEKGGTSIRPASLVAAESSVRTEDNTKAIQVAANRSDTQSLAAARWAKLGPTITGFVFAALVGLWHFIQYVIAHAGQ